MTSIVFDFDDIGSRYRALGTRWLGEPEQPAITAFQCTRSYGGLTCPGICVKQCDAGQPQQCADFGGKPISSDPYIQRLRVAINGRDIEEFNDARGRTKEDILEVYDRAIAARF